MGGSFLWGLECLCYYCFVRGGEREMEGERAEEREEGEREGREREGKSWWGGSNHTLMRDL